MSSMNISPNPDWINRQQQASSGLEPDQISNWQDLHTKLAPPSKNNTPDANEAPSTSQDGKIDVFTIDAPAQNANFMYDLDGDGGGETAHFWGVEAGLRSYTTEADLQVYTTELTTSNLVKGLEECLKRAKEGSIDTAYFALGLILPMDAIGQILENENLTPQDLQNNPELQEELRELILESDDSLLQDFKRAILLLDEISEYIPVYASAGNDEDVFNIMGLAEGVTLVGSESEYSSQVYDRKVQTDFVWQRVEGGWEILDRTGDNTRSDEAVDFQFDGQDRIEGQDHKLGRKTKVSGGTSLGVALAVGQDILDGKIVDRGLG